MSNVLFLACCVGLASIALPVAFRLLPRERWQFIATIPLRREDGEWAGLNFTSYGVISATASMLAVVMYALLLASAGVPSIGIALSAVAFLIVCAPAAKAIAWWVEGDKDTFTVGGASFVGILMMPGVVWVLNQAYAHRSDLHFELWPLLAAMGIAYVIGEGVGRLACISFGCCWGTPLEHAQPWAQRLFRTFHFRFDGDTRKIHYAGQLGDAAVIPVQAITSTLFVGIGIVGAAMFLAGNFAAAFVTTLVVSQLWRVVSEVFRADPRGGRTFTVYQAMALAAAVYVVGIAVVAPTGGVGAPLAIADGIAVVWTPLALLGVQALWITMFLYMGTSTVSGARVSYYIRRGCEDAACTASHSPARSSLPPVVSGNASTVM